MSEHPSIDRIFEVVRRSEAEHGEVRRHLAECAGCREQAVWIEDVLSAVGPGRLPQPPEEVLARAIAIPESVPRPRRRDERETGWSLGRLVADAFARPALAGVRGAAPARRALYETADAHLDLEVAMAPEDAALRRVTGQLLVGDETAGYALAVLWRDRTVVARAFGDEAGVFVFDGVAPGVYSLEAWSPGRDRAIRVDPLEIDGEAE